MEVSVRYGRLLRKPGFKTIDAEFTLAGPFVLLSCLFGYFFTFYSLNVNSGGLLDFFSVSAPLLSFFVFGLAAFALIFI